MHLSPGNSILISNRFRANFADVDWVRVPKVIWEVSSPEVLVLEYVPGTKINDAASLDRWV